MRKHLAKCLLVPRPSFNFLSLFPRASASAESQRVSEQGRCLINCIRRRASAEKKTLECLRAVQIRKCNLHSRVLDLRAVAERKRCFLLVVGKGDARTRNSLPQPAAESNERKAGMDACFEWRAGEGERDDA
jgi:hypothetical protein